MLAAVATIVILTDQVTKSLFAYRDFFLGPIHIHAVKNYGLPFGINFHSNLNLTVVIVSFVVFCGYFLFIKKDQKAFIALNLIASAAVSNLIDRIHLGYVRDFIDLGLGFTFNLADLFIVTGLIFLLLFNHENHEKNLGN